MSDSRTNKSLNVNAQARGPQANESQESGHLLSVTELVAITRSLLEEAMPEVVFKGEISEVKSGKTGHLYFTVRDETTQVSAVMWASVAARSRLKLLPGLAVKIAAHPTVYGPRGSLQFVVHRISEAGEGTLQKKFLELKTKLEREGLFSPSRKRALPFLPRTIGVVTSANGAVIHDIMHRVSERFPGVQVVLIDVRVQGEGSAEEIARAIEQFNAMAQKATGNHPTNIAVDVLIVGRGGGSLEDLWAFNEERVVRAIYASAIPVVSAVGHESDVTLADLVADVRAPTPTAAAEILVPRADELMQRVSELAQRLLNIERVLAPLEQRLDEVQMRLERSIELVFERARNTVKFSEQRLKMLHPRVLMEQANTRIDQLTKRLALAGRSTVERFSMQLSQHAIKLQAINPRAVLKRGYAVVKIGALAVRNASEAPKGSQLDILLGDGELRAEVMK